MAREHDNGPIACPKCGGETVPQDQNRILCPTCGALGEWFAWCGSTDQGFYDGPVDWKRIGWVDASVENPLPHVTVVGWYGSETLALLVHDGSGWSQDGVPGVAPPRYWLALPPDPA